jgi:hypothetical protein
LTPDAAALMREIGYDKKIVGITGNVLQNDIDNFLMKVTP